jgi:hypothetical protein
MSIKDFPYLLLKVSSENCQQGDKYRLLLQASCLVRLGNVLLTDQSFTFFVKAIYVDHDFCAVEYTLYQRRSETGDDKVAFSFMSRHGRLTPVGRLNIARRPMIFLTDAPCLRSFSAFTISSIR